LLLHAFILILPYIGRVIKHNRVKKVQKRIIAAFGLIGPGFDAMPGRFEGSA
jgi:hypothetical protein